MPRNFFRGYKDEKPTLCSICNAIDTRELNWKGTTWIPHQPSVFALTKAARKLCPLCRLIYTALDTAGLIVKDKWLVPAAIQIAGYGRAATGTRPVYGLQHLRIRCGTSKQFASLGIYVNEESPAALSKKVAGRVVRPADDFRTARSWLDTCRSSHRLCHVQVSKRLRPTRLLDVQAQNSLRIVSGKTCKGEFATLSHCWGSQTIVQLTKALSQQFELEISWDLLSKTFKEAIAIARGLAIPYLWIDSLCIVQDDPLDWERESANMARIYAQSTVNILCCASRNSDGGCFQSRLPPAAFAELKDDENEGSTIKVGPLLGFGESVIRSPLLSRGWVVQERMLARRKLYYSKDQLYWHCSEIYLSECGNQSEDLDFRNDVERNFSDSVEPSILWQNLVAEYTACKLTRKEDKFPAISGLASKFAVATSRKYVAGLWEDDLLNGLLWFSVDRSIARRHDTYIAPSWSWASVEGPVLYPVRYSAEANSGLYSAVVHTRQTHVGIAGKDAYGRLVSGRITIEGTFKRIGYRYYPRPTVESRQFDIDLIAQSHGKQDGLGNILLGPVEFDGPFTKAAIGAACLDAEEEPSGPIYCLLMTPTIALLLQPTRLDRTVYHRIGIAWIPRSKPEAPFKFSDLPNAIPGTWVNDSLVTLV